MKSKNSAASNVAKHSVINSVERAASVGRNNAMTSAMRPASSLKMREAVRAATARRWRVLRRVAR